MANKSINKKEKKEVSAKEATKSDEEKLFAVLCYLISIIGVIIVLATKSERKPFSIYHAKQGLILFIAEIGVGIIAGLLGFMSLGLHFMWWFFTLISWILWIVILVLVVIGIINAVTDKQKPLPIIGQFAEKINF